MPPRAKKKPVIPVEPTPEPVVVEVKAQPSRLPVLYPVLEIAEYSSTSEKGPVDPQWAKDVLGWETEPEFQARKVMEFPGTKPEAWAWGDTGPKIDGEGAGFQPIHCRNIEGEKVVCWNNTHNRPFDMDWCESLIHTILYGAWAGPHTIPGETVNGETIRISRHGEMLSAQHQLTALILSDEKLALDRQNGVDNPAQPKYPVWRTHPHPFLETIVIKGVSSDPRVLMTIDYTKPRSAADVLYTSEVFREAVPSDRRELCRMLAQEVDTLWERTEARGYKTHPEVVGFLNRHKRLLECVLHLFSENNPTAGRKISKLRLSPGTCSALMYLMGTAGPATDSDYYRNMEPAPEEKALDFSLWNRAEEFWTLLTGGKDFAVVRQALALLVESDPLDEQNKGLGGRSNEKLAILSHAWERWRDHEGNGQPFDEGDLEPGGLLCLSYTDLDDRGNKLPDGQVKLIDIADFGGIDCPQVRTSRASKDQPPDPPIKYTKEEMEAATEAARARRIQRK